VTKHKTAPTVMVGAVLCLRGQTDRAGQDLFVGAVKMIGVSRYTRSLG
jgi:hypothetical protein